MADPNPTADGVAGTEADPNAPEFSLQSVYLKDCSFEAPKGPRVEGQWNPYINLELDTATEILSPDLREIVLRISVTAKNGDATWVAIIVEPSGSKLRNGSDKYKYKSLENGNKHANSRTTSTTALSKRLRSSIR